MSQLFTIVHLAGLINKQNFVLSLSLKMECSISSFDIKLETFSEDSRFSTLASPAVRDEACQRLSIVEEGQDGIKQLVQKSIYLEPMRAFLSKVKQHSNELSPHEELEYLLLAVSCIDLTSLAGDDTHTNVSRLCYRAVAPLDENLARSQVSCAAVCVYPARVIDCRTTLKKLNQDNRIKIASVATGFPSGQYSLKTRIAEIKDAVENGATEIDVVINRPAALAWNWPVVFEELCEMRKACDIREAEKHEVSLKVIIAAGDLLMSSPNTIYNASLVAILAGADFIKTSTGKETVNATLPIGYIMMRCIADYHNLTNIKIGFKPAGGIRTYRDALNWLVLVKMLLGPEWLNNRLFRFGASGLLDDLEKRIKQLTSLVESERS